MPLTVVGLSHHTAPVDVRERVAVPEPELAATLLRAAALFPSDGAGGEAMIVSTCNRVEFYLVAADGPDARRRVAALLAEGRQLDPGRIEEHLYLERGEAALRHLFRVASSLDSVVVGEPQILGQVKQAYNAAGQAGTVGPVLGHVLPRAFATAKRVRSETDIARTSANVASAAVDLGRRIFGDLKGREVLVVGAGKMGALAARHLLGAGCGRLLVTNRTLERAEQLVRDLSDGAGPAEAQPWSALPGLLARADIVLCSTGAVQPVITRDAVQRAMKARRGRWLCLLDIAVPRDVEADAGEIENVYLYDVDALTDVVEGHREGRRREAHAAEAIVAEEVARFQAQQSARGVVPTIRALREHCSAIARGEVERALGKLQGASERDRREVQAMADAIVNKLLHQPLTALKREPDSEAMVAAVRRLFGLREEPSASAPVAPSVSAPAAAAPGPVAGAAEGGSASRVAAAPAGGEEPGP